MGNQILLSHTPWSSSNSHCLSSLLEEQHLKKASQRLKDNLVTMPEMDKQPEVVGSKDSPENCWAETICYLMRLHMPCVHASMQLTSLIYGSLWVMSPGQPVADLEAYMASLEKSNPSRRMQLLRILIVLRTQMWLHMYYVIYVHIYIYTTWIQWIL